MTPMEALAALQDAFCSDVDAIPEGFLTVKGWAAAWGKSLSQTGALLSKGEGVGKVERKTFRIRTGNKTYPVPHYRVML